MAAPSRHDPATELSRQKWSGTVHGEVVVQGNLYAHGDINIVTNQARSVFRTISESPNAFGSVQAKIQGMISTLIAVSSITDEYTREGRLDAANLSNLVELAGACQGTLGRLEDLRSDFEKWGMQGIRNEAILEMTTALDRQIQELTDINTTIVNTSVKLESLLESYIAEVLSGQCASSIRSASTISSLSSTEREAWTQVRREMQSIGISPQQFDQNREMIIKTLQEAFGQDAVGSAPRPIKKASQISLFLSVITGRDDRLIQATLNRRVDAVKYALEQNADVDARRNIWKLLESFWNTTQT